MFLLSYNCLENFSALREVQVFDYVISQFNKLQTACKRPNFHLVIPPEIINKPTIYLKQFVRGSYILIL